MLADKMWEVSSRRKSENHRKSVGRSTRKPFKTVVFFASKKRMFSACPLNPWKSSIFPTCWCGSGGFHSYLQDKPVRNSSLAKLFPVRNYASFVAMQCLEKYSSRFLTRLRCSAMSSSIEWKANFLTKSSGRLKFVWPIDDN